MELLKLIVNKQEYFFDGDDKTPLLWVLRDTLGLTGTKYGCGKGICGACVVHVEGEAVRSCITPVSTVVNKNITTIEGLSIHDLHPLQKAWITEDVPQCGYCQPGQIMTAAALLLKNPHPNDEEIRRAMGMVLCRCGSYIRIFRAIKRMVEKGGK